MKKLILLLALTFPFAAFAQSNYTGIWATDTDQPMEYYSIHQNGNDIVVATLDASKGQWSAYEGVLTDAQVTLRSIFSIGADISVEVQFTSPTQAQFTILSCKANPEYFCALPIDIPFPMKKIF